METFQIRKATFQLHPERAIYWKQQKALLLADLHLGKNAHFRKSGIAVPQAITDANFDRLRLLIETFSPERVLLLGDLFHSHHNQVWPIFCAFMEAYPGLSFELIPGNHDILPTTAYAESRLLLHPEILVVDEFCLSHHPLTPAQIPAGTYNLCGHVHPSVRLLDNAGNGMNLPAFFFGGTGGILPAFGEFTGCAEVAVRPEDKVFVLAEGAVIRMS